MNHQFGALSLFELTGNVNGVDDERVDNVVIPADPVAAFFAKAELGAYMGDPSWDEPIAATPQVQLSKAFRERSDARLHRVAEKIRKIFGSHAEEAEEAISIANEMLQEARSYLKRRKENDTDR